MCHYHQVYVDREWQLLERVPDRCGSRRVLRTVTARFGQTVRVPDAPGDIDVARFDGVVTSLIDRLRTLVYAGRELYFRAGGVTRKPKAYRFLPGTQGSAHVLAMPECASRDLDGTGHAIQTFALSDNRAARATDDRYTVTFEAIRLRC